MKSPSKRNNSAFVVGILASLLFALAVPALAQRPANVPEEYVVTPFGYMHSSCVVHLNEGDTVGEDLFLHHADGTSDAIPTCAYPRYNKKGEVVETTQTETTKSSVPVPTISWAWVEDAAAFPSINLGEEYSIWTVPPSPTSLDGQLLYFFPGLGNILQPVLGWNADFSNSWGIASWECCLNNSSLESKAIPVNSGDSILGTVVQGCSFGTNSCATWNITTTDQTTRQSTTTNNSALAGQQNNAVEGVMEVYNVVQCSDYPPNGEIVFDTWFYDYNGNPVLPSWGTGTDTTDSPQCNYSAQATATQVALTYNTTQSSSYNVSGIYTNGTSFSSGGLDGDGYAYSSTEIGASQSYDGSTIPFGAANGNDAWSNTTIPISASIGYSKLLLLGTGVNGNQTSQTFTVTYTNGATSTFTQSLSDWFTPQSYSGETKVADLAYRNTSSGGEGNGPLYLYGYAIPLTSGLTVKSLTLPANRNVIVLGYALSGPVTPVSLFPEYNREGIVTDGTTFSAGGGVDDDGSAYSSSLLGYSVTWNNASFDFGPANANNAVSTSGQTISLPAGQFSALRLLATGVNGNQTSQTFTVTYSDGSTASFTQSLSDWFTPQSYSGETQVVASSYRDSSSGSKDSRTFYLYGYSFGLTNTKTVSSVKLPSNSNVEVLAITLVP